MQENQFLAGMLKGRRAMKINEYLKKNWIFLAIVLIAFTVGLFSFRGADRREDQEYQQRIDNLTAGNQQIDSELRTAEADLKSLTDELRKTKEQFEEVERTNRELEKNLAEQRELLDQLEREHTSITDNAGVAGEGIGRALEGLDDLIKEIQNPSSFQPDRMDNSGD